MKNIALVGLFGCVANLLSPAANAQQSVVPIIDGTAVLDIPKTGYKVDGILADIEFTFSLDLYGVVTTPDLAATGFGIYGLTEASIDNRFFGEVYLYDFVYEGGSKGDEFEFHFSPSTLDAQIWLDTKALGLEGGGEKSLSIGYNTPENYIALSGVVFNTINLKFAPQRVYFYYGYSDTRLPEPASWAMMLCGFGVVGGAMRYRRKRPVGLA